MLPAPFQTENTDRDGGEAEEDSKNERSRMPNYARVGSVVDVDVEIVQGAEHVES
jgi:hypothetical protein